ncbi:MAG TPA: 30S ribosome-binding factor RbfA [Bacteroidia bacterium]|nr:30S ribosome-binding factor RbfA [Bacteroidia bacterium]
MDSRRQEKFAKLIQRDLGDIFQQKSSSLFKGNFITISGVKVSPDLGYAKVYLSFFNPKNRQELMDLLEVNKREIRHELAGKIKNQVRKIPELEFYMDESLDYVQHMEDVFRKIKEEENQRNHNTND